MVKIVFKKILLIFHIYLSHRIMIIIYKKLGKIKSLILVFHTDN